MSEPEPPGRHSSEDLPSLNLLRAFEAAGYHLSFKKAAEQLFVTPSAVSQQIKLLEQQLSVRLFVRGNRTLRLTPAGAAYWGRVRNQLEELRAATLELKRQYPITHLNVSIMPPVAKRIVLPQLDSFYRQHPELEIRIQTDATYSDLHAGLADLAIRFGIPPWGDLCHEKLIDVYIQLLCPPGYTETYELGVDLTQVADIPLIHMTNRPDAWWDFWFSREGLEVPDGRKFFVDDYPAAIDACETLGAALGLFPIENPLVETGRVEAPYPPMGPLEQAVYAVYPESIANSTAVRAFIDWLRKQLQALEIRPESD